MDDNTGAPSLAALREAAAAGPPYAPELLGQLARDPRKGAQALLAACHRREAAQGTERFRLETRFVFEREAALAGFTRIAGIDEAGRGPLAGPIVAAAAILTELVPGLDDSKRLTATERERLFEVLTGGGHTLGVALVEAAEIDRIGIQAANYQAMAGAINALQPPPDFLLIDGFALPGVAQPQKKLVKGDQRSLSIAAASIMAKVTRDRIMDEWNEKYPEYGFAKHRGYGTAEHLAALERLGPCPAHRMSFAPLARPTETGLLF